MHVRQLVNKYDEIRQMGAQVLVAAPGTAAEAAKLAERMKLPFPVLADESRTALDTFGFAKIWLGLMQQNGTVVLDPSGEMLYVTRASMPNTSLDMPGLLEALKKAS